VKLVRQAFERLNRGDVEGVVDLCDENFVIDMSGRVFNPALYRGHDGIRRFYGDVREVWEHYEWNVEDTLTSGIPSSRCSTVWDAAGGAVWRSTGAWVIWIVRDGRGISLRFYRERARALKAAGLRESRRLDASRFDAPHPVVARNGRAPYRI
jgi:ketosteroid isomerase-like protein